MPAILSLLGCCSNCALETSGLSSVPVPGATSARGHPRRFDSTANFAAAKTPLQVALKNPLCFRLAAEALVAAGLACPPLYPRSSRQRLAHSRERGVNPSHLLMASSTNAAWDRGPSSLTSSLSSRKQCPADRCVRRNSRSSSRSRSTVHSPSSMER